MAQGESKPTGPGGPGQDQPRIHVDADWKKEAQAEKERLAREVERGAAAKSGAAGGAVAGLGTDIGTGAAPGGAPRELPAASFASLVQTLATQAAIFLSNQRDPETGASIRNLELAKHNIDLLRILEEKTKGNLTDEEKRLLETMLYELLMAYVEAAE